MVALGPGRAHGVSPDGAVIVGSTGGQAFRWTSGTGIVRIGPGAALDASFDGSVVVGGGPDGAFIWDAGAGRRLLSDVLVTEFGLDLTGWTLTGARAVSYDGRTIVGSGFNPSGQVEAWIAVVPEPHTGVLVMVGLLGMAGQQRRRAYSGREEAACKWPFRECRVRGTQRGSRRAPRERARPQAM